MLVERRESKIHGNGVFAKKVMHPEEWQHVYGEIIPLQPHPMEHYCMEADEGQYLPYAPWCWLNSSKSPNCEIVWEDDSYFIQVIEHIFKGDELTIDYGFTP